MTQRCYLRMGDDYLEDAVFCEKLGHALSDFWSTARELSRYGQRIEATIHFVDKKGDEPGEYPDRVLSLGPRGGLVVSHT